MRLSRGKQFCRQTLMQRTLLQRGETQRVTFRTFLQAPPMEDDELIRELEELMEADEQEAAVRGAEMLAEPPPRKGCSCRGRCSGSHRSCKGR